MTTQTETSVNDDLQGLIEIAQLATAARDAMSDEIVSRMAGTMSEGLILLDRLTRNEGLMKLLQVLDRQDSQNLLIAFSEAIHTTSQEIAAAPPAKGGVGCLMRVVRDPGTLEGIRFLTMLGKYMSKGLREQHRHGD